MNYALLSLKKMGPSMLLFELSHVTRSMSDDDARMVLSAAELASYLHRDQRRFVRDGMPKVPYIEHPLRNALRIARWGSRDAKLLTIALLHDVVEDCSKELCELRGVTPNSDTPPLTIQRLAVAELRQMYGVRVAEGVAMLTTGFFDAQESYLAHIERFADNSSDFVLVKASDLHDNAGSLKHQIGAMKTSSFVKRLVKYTPAVEVMVDALLAWPMGNEVIDNASKAMNKLSHTLEQLNIQFNTELAPKN